jgi:hypothetical protein
VHPAEPSGGEVGPREPEDLPEPMRPWERLVVVLLGVTAGGIGCYAVFNSSNQAGTAVLLVIGAAFVLIGIQGTPLIRFGTGANNVELERRRRRVEREAQQAREEGDPDLARDIVETASILDPGIVPAPEVLGAIYKDQVRHALLRAGARVRDRSHIGTGVDMIAETSKGAVAVVVRYRRRSPLTLQYVNQAISNWKPEGTAGLLVITNAPLSGAVRELNATVEHRPAVEIITWNDEQDDGILIQALERLAR